MPNTCTFWNILFAWSLNCMQLYCCVLSNFQVQRHIKVARRPRSLPLCTRYANRRNAENNRRTRNVALPLLQIAAQISATQHFAASCLIVLRRLRRKWLRSSTQIDPICSLSEFGESQRGGSGCIAWMHCREPFDVVSFVHFNSANSGGCLTGWSSS